MLYQGNDPATVRTIFPSGTVVIDREPRDDKPSAWTMLYVHKPARDLVPIDSYDSCPICGADLGPSTLFPWHEPDDDCRAIREPLLYRLYFEPAVPRKDLA